MVEDVGITLHVYSQARNRDEASQIIQFLGFVLNNEIEIDYYSFIKSRIDTQEVITDIDQYTKHGIIRLVFKYRHNITKECNEWRRINILSLKSLIRI